MTLNVLVRNATAGPLRLSRSSRGNASLLPRDGAEVGKMCVTAYVGATAGRRALSTAPAATTIAVRSAPRYCVGTPRTSSLNHLPGARPTLTFPAIFASRTMASHSRPEQVRRDSKMSGPYDTYEAVVVGAGPAGITAVGNLLENRLDKILWVDDQFNGGRVNGYYREVPSNTKAKLFIDFATAVAPFRKIVSGLPSRDRYEEPSPSDGAPVDGTKDKLQDMRQLDQEKGCQLSHAADVCLMLTQGLKRTPGVITQKGRVEEASFDENAKQWSINIDSENNSPEDITNVQAKRLILCTGSSPMDPTLPYEPKHLEHIDLDVALSPTRLSGLLSQQGQTTVAVIGASHSAVLVLMNLSNLALSTRPDLKVKWFTRHPLRYAEYEDGFIARDNTGLKGEAAVWARETLEPEKLPENPVGKVITPIRYNKGDEESVYREHLDDCQYVIQAIGYSRNPLPALKEADTGKAIEPHFDHDRGVFNYVTESECGSIGDLRPLPGLYGAGIAFPQRVVDKNYGHEEYNVGFFKFMKAVKQWVGDWKEIKA